MLVPSYTLQIINGFFTILVIWTMCVFLRYIWNERKLGYTDLRAAIAISVLLAGEAFLRVPLWLARIQANRSGEPTTIPDLWLMIGGSLAVVSLLCIIRVFSPRDQGQMSWVTALSFSTLVTIVSVAYTFRWI